MPAASFLQTSFLGGLWSPAYQGRADDEGYRAALNVCLNGLPLEEGSWTRRAGTKIISTTRGGQKGRLLQFAFSNAQPYMMEFTDGFLRFNDGQTLLYDLSPPVIASISSDNPAVVTTKTAHGWSTGKRVAFPVVSTSTLTGALALTNREFAIEVINTTSFYLYDGVTALPFDGSSVTWAGNPLVVAGITEYASPYTNGNWSRLRKVQNETLCMLLNPTVAPYVVEGTAPTGPTNAAFTFSKAVFEDGPYMDPVPNGTILTLTDTTGKLEYTVTYQAWLDDPKSYSLGDVVQASGVIYQSLQDNNRGHAPASNPSYWQAAPGWPGLNGGQGFVATDVGRSIRILMEPATWSVGTAYSVGNAVKYNGLYYTALQSTTANQPDVSPTFWEVSVSTAVAGWTWLQIVSVVSAGVVDVQGKGVPLINSLPISTWRLGLYSDTTGYPTCGCFHQGRFWLAGAQPNRVDATVTNAIPSSGWTNAFNMAPTAVDGTVSDNNGLSYVFENEDTEVIYWMVPDHQGIVCGTAGGEWSIQASSAVDPLTPTSVQAHKNTKYKGANIDPVRTGLSIAFVQLHQRKLIEYVADVYSGKYSGTNLSKKAAHLTTSLFQELAYQQETTPVLWARMGDGSLISCTYRRESPFSSQPANFAAWAQHSLGTGRKVISIQTGPSPNGGTLDSLTMVTQDPATGYCYMEQMQRLFDEDVSIQDAWQLDGGIQPILSDYFTGTPDKVRLYGLALQAGQTVDIWAGGIDAGSFTIAADGHVDVPMGGLLTKDYLAAISGGSIGRARVNWGAGPPAVNNSATLKSYTPTMSDVSNAQDNVAAYDWLNNYVASTTANANVRIFNLASQAQIAEVDGAAYNGFNNLASGLDGNLYVYGGYPGPIGSNAIYKVRPTDGTILAMGKWTYTSTDGFVPLLCGSDHYLVNLSLHSLAGATIVGILSTQSMLSAATYAINGKYSIACRADQSSANGVSEGRAYVLTNGSNSSTAGPFRLYKVAINSASSSRYSVAQVGSDIQLSAVHGAWSDTDNMALNSCFFDHADGSVIVSITNTTAGGSAYLVKINTNTGAIVWSTSNIAAGVPTGLREDSLSRFGYMVYADASLDQRLYTVNLADGSSAHVASNANISWGSTQAFNDGTGQIVWRNLGGVLVTMGPSTAQTLGPGQPPYAVPFTVGKSFTSRGQILRALSPQEAGAQNGPALAKVRRAQQTGYLLRRSQGMSFGTDFAKLHAADFRSPGGTSYAATSLFSGTWWDTVDDNYGFDSMVCWQITRPYPAAVLAVEVFLQTQDRG